MPPPSNGRKASASSVLEARLLRTQALARIGSWEIDLATGLLWGSEEAFRIYGLPLSASQVLPLEVVQSIPLPTYRAALDQALAGLISGTNAYDIEFEIRRQSDGQVRHIHSRAELVRDEAGAPLLVSGTLHDNTELVARDRALMDSLRASEERARAAFEQAADAIFLGNPEGRFIATNESALELTGYSQEELANQHIRMLFSADVHRQKPLRFDRVERGERVISERLLTRKDGSQVPVEMHTKKLSDGTLQSIMRDLTDRRRLEEQLQLRQRMDSVGTLTSGIAHDFNNILAGIMGYTSLLTERSAHLDPEQLDYLANISQATQRGADLVNSLKLLSNPAPETRDQFDLFDVASEVMRVLSVTTDRVIQKHLRVNEGEFLVRGTSSDLYHALMNLCVNSVQAIDSKGATAKDGITIEANRFEVRDQHPLDLAPGSYVHILVADTGNGMSPQVRKRAFEPLFSTKAPGESKGQGLGLAMVYNIVVRQHGGAVDIDSSPGQGCRIHLYLPAADHCVRPMQPTGAPPTPPPISAAGYERILIVEDEPQLARLTRTILEGFGYSVLVATDGREAVDLFRREQDTIDLVLLDRSLPGLRGEQVYTELVSTRPDITVVVSTGDAMIPGEAFAGAYQILQKPYPPSRLRAVIRQALDERKTLPVK